jgi:hypothetical protein
LRAGHKSWRWPRHECCGKDAGCDCHHDPHEEHDPEQCALGICGPEPTELDYLTVASFLDDGTGRFDSLAASFERAAARARERRDDSAVCAAVRQVRSR